MSDIQATEASGLSPVDAQYLIDHIVTVPDFPKEGILFRDFLPLLTDYKALHLLLDTLEKALPISLDDFDAIAGLEARGFLMGVALADRLHKGFIAVRKPGKLPGKIYTETYSLEYGEESIQIEDSAVRSGQRVLIVDDLIATGGSARAAANLIERAGGVVAGFSFVMKLEGLNGMDKLNNLPATALLSMPA